jgi:hypothetical protein
MAAAPKGPAAAGAGQRISREEVVMAWRLLLGREPESEQVIETHRLDSLDELRVVLIKSNEFAHKYQVIYEKKPE